jgi:hypothetical protein
LLFHDCHKDLITQRKRKEGRKEGKKERRKLVSGVLNIYCAFFMKKYSIFKEIP